MDQKGGKMSKQLIAPCIALVSLLLLGAGAAGAFQPGLGGDETAFETTCTVTIDCDAGGQVSCTSTNNNCTTQGECVYCDNQRSACCPDTQACIDNCFDIFMACFRACGPFVPGDTCHQDCYDERMWCEDWCING
jgi:hypothetical protein